MTASVSITVPLNDHVYFFLQLFVYPRAFSFSFWTYATLSRTEKPLKVLIDIELRSTKNTENFYSFFFSLQDIQFFQKGIFQSPNWEELSD